MQVVIVIGLGHDARAARFLDLGIIKVDELHHWMLQEYAYSLDRGRLVVDGTVAV